MNIDANKFAREVLLKRLDDLEFQDFRDHADEEGLGGLGYEQLESIWGQLQQIRKMIAHTPAPAATVYKTVIPARWPEQKLHDTLGNARAAVGYAGRGMKARGGRIYKMNDHTAGWQLVHDIPERTPQSELPWKKK